MTPPLRYRPVMGCGCPGPAVTGASAHERNHGSPPAFTDRDTAADGARYMEAIRGARAMRERVARNYDHPMLGGAFPFEREQGTLWFCGSWPR